MSSGPPRVASRAKFDQVTWNSGANIALLCEAQGYPLPAFRY